MSLENKKPPVQKVKVYPANAGIEAPTVITESRTKKGKPPTQVVRAEPAVFEARHRLGQEQAMKMFRIDLDFLRKRGIVKKGETVPLNEIYRRMERYRQRKSLTWEDILVTK